MKFEIKELTRGIEISFEKKFIKKKILLYFFKILS